MADDVFQHAARQPPDPITNITTNDNTHKAKEHEDNKMAIEQEGNAGNQVITRFYGNYSTTVYGTLPNNSNSYNINTNTTPTLNTTESVVQDSNTTISSYPQIQRASTQSAGASQHRYQTSNITSTSTTEPPQTPSTPNTSNTSTGVVHTTPDNMDISTEMSPSKIPPIRPFTLSSKTSRSPFRRKDQTSPGPLDMQALHSAANNALIQQNLPTIPTEINEEDSSSSVTQMDTADVSTLKPKLPLKTINNPYSKLHRTPLDDSVKPESATNLNKHDRANKSNSSSSPPILNTTTTASTNEDTTASTPTTKTAEFEELSQEDLELVEQAFATQDEQQAWIEVPQKPTKATQFQSKNSPHKTDNNPFSPLRSDDDDTQSSTGTTKTSSNPKTTSSDNTTTVSIEPNNINTNQPSTSAKPPPTNHQSNLRPITTKGHPTAGRGGGKITRNSHTNLSEALRTVATSKPVLENPNQSDEMELDDPHTPKSPPNTTTGNTNPKPPPNTNTEHQTQTSLRRAVNQPLKYSYQIYIRAFPNEKETEHYTRINIINIVLTALQTAEPDTKIVIPSNTYNEQRTYSTINPKSKNINEIKNIEQLLQIHNNGLIQGN
jgi:hypothetical protein